MTIEGHFQAFQDARTAIKQELKWRAEGQIRDAVALAALPYAADGKAVDYEQLKLAAQTLKENHNRLSVLRSSARYAIAVTLLSAGEDPLQFTQKLSAARPMWKAQGLRRTAPYEGGALLMLLLSVNKSVDPAMLATLKAAYDQLKQLHFWHVGPFTLVTLALALQHNGNAAVEGEQLFEELRARKLRGRNIMSTALLASISRKSLHEKADWMMQFQDALRSLKMRTAAQSTTSLALSSLLGQDPNEHAETINQFRQRFKDGPFRSTNAGLLALNFVNMSRALELGQQDKAVVDLPEVASVMSALQAYIALQQQAAVAGAVAASVAAGAAAS
jgi:hypothetical protein